MGLFLVIPVSLLGLIFGSICAVIIGLCLLAWIGEMVLSFLAWALPIAIGVGLLIFLFRWAYRDKRPYQRESLPQAPPPPEPPYMPRWRPPRPSPRPSPRGGEPPVVVNVNVLVQGDLHVHAGGGLPPEIREVVEQAVRDAVRERGGPRHEPRILPPKNRPRGPSIIDIVDDNDD